MKNKPHFKINNNFQKKKDLYSDMLTNEILTEICMKITGQHEFTCEFKDEVNKGRLAILKYENTVHYISFSETEIQSRNSSMQSFPTALVKYQLSKEKNKHIYFFFLPSIGNFETNYFVFIYRLMKTAGVQLLNEEVLKKTISPFTSVEDIISSRNTNKSKHKHNNSTYLTTNANNIIQIFGKTYGASKYETTLLCLSLDHISTCPIELYQIGEGGLTQLPKLSIEAIEYNNNIKIYTSDITMEKQEFEENNSLRSPKYTYNLLKKLGNKKCAFCDCEIPQIIQGAHILPVADIKKSHHMSQDEKLVNATDGENGIWLCQNHHKLFDVNILIISDDGKIKYKSDIKTKNKQYIRVVTRKKEISADVLTKSFIEYLNVRNKNIKESLYCDI